MNFNFRLQSPLAGQKKRTMKRIIPHIPNITASASVLFASVVVFASAFLLSGCSESELPGDDANGNTNRPALTIEVSDGGYAPSAGEKSATRENPATRATENGYTTQFTAGDKIGVYAVKDGAIVDGVNNLCLVATATTAPDGSTSLVWQTTDGKTPFNISGAAYYAYYPWQSDTDMANKVTASADNAATFFADVISGWTPSPDQGTYAAYTSFDLMIAKGTTSGKTLSFPMQHQMALVVIDLPRTKYTLTDAGGNSLSDYILDAPDTRFNGFAPCRMGDGTYRYLIKPAVTGSQSTTLSGSYTTNATSATAEWELTANVPASQYKKYVVDNAPVITKSHQLKVGDFFMKDGTLLSKTEALSDEEKAACIGIVYWVGNPTKITPANDVASIGNKDQLQGDQTLANDHKDCTHGLVVSLGEESCSWQASQTSVQDWLNSNHLGKFLSVQSGTGASDPSNNIQGYNNTKAIEAFNESPDNSGNEVYVVQKVVDYRKTVSAPAASSGWYVPSEKELTLLCGKDVDNIYTNNSGGTTNRDFINGKLRLIGTTTLLSSSDYWSSTENSHANAFRVYFGGGDVDYCSKFNPSFRVRFSFAF